MFGHRDSVAGIEMRARHQRAGYLWKLPMSKSTSEKWQRRLFVAKDGFLLYYSGSTPIVSTHFDTKPKGVIPLGGCKVDLVERGPKSFRYGLRITHPDFLSGRMLILAAETADEQRAWLEALNDCSRVTMENAKLGDAMVEKLRAAGTTAEKEKADAMERLQQHAMALRNEQEERMKLAAESETLKSAVVEAEERAKRKEEDLALMTAEVEKRKAEVDAQAVEMQREIEQRAAALAASSAEYAKVTAALAEGGSGELEDRARALEEEKYRLEQEKHALEKSVRDLAESTITLKSNLDSAEEQRLQMEAKLRSLQSEEGDLAQERSMRKRLERKLQIAEESLKRLDSALKRSGVKMDVDVFADVKTLLSFFEERVDEVRRDAQRIEIMKKALKAKRRYLVASAKADTVDAVALAEIDAADKALDDAWEEDKLSRTALQAPAPPARASVAPPKSPRPAPPPSAPAPAPPADEWGDDDSEAAPAADSEDEGSTAPKPAVKSGDTVDQYGALPSGWTVQTDDEGDMWYYNEATQQTSWYRPNPDGTVPEA